MLELTKATEPTDVIQILRPILQPIYEALEVSVPEAYAIIKEYGWASPSLPSHIVRASAKLNLDGRACPVEFDDGERIVNMEAVANDGLSTVFEGITIKIWKGRSLPRAHTDSRKSFYQHTQNGLWVSDGPPPILSLIVFWDCDSEGGNLRLWLCCPKNSRGHYIWFESIPHPSSWMVVNKPENEKVDDFDDLLGDERKDGIKKVN
jgi:hypothetical protein